jgi:aryl-alcohol dehydrogenase-like predicted oxidoreductase
MKIQGIGLGTFPFSNVFGLLNEQEAEKITFSFLDRGGKYIQTAPYYTNVDPLMGKILKNRSRDSYFLGTLCAKDRQNAKSGKYSSIVSQCEDSLTQLRTEYIDLYLTSTPKVTDAPFSETIGAMLDLQKQGKIRGIGVCNVTLEQLKEYNTSGAVKYVQNRFSLVDQSFDNNFLTYCHQNDIQLIAYNVIEWGILTNKILKDLNLRENDLRTQVLPVFNDEPLGVLRQWVIHFLKPIAERNNTKIEALAIHWALNQYRVAVCLVGATRNEQILSSLNALNLNGRTDIVKQLDVAYKELSDGVKIKYGKELNDFLKNSYGKW